MFRGKRRLSYASLGARWNAQFCSSLDGAAMLEQKKVVVTPKLPGMCGIEKANTLAEQGRRKNNPDLSFPHSCDDGVDVDCVSDYDTSDGSSCATFFGDDLTALEPDRLRDCLYDIIRYDRCWGRLWKVFCDCLTLRQWEDVNPVDIAHFLPAARSVISVAHLDANVNVSDYTPWMCRLTGGWERFLVDTLHVQYSVFASPWNAVSPAILSPIDACQELGALPHPVLQDAVGHSGALCFVRSDTHVNPTDAAHFLSVYFFSMSLDQK